MYVGFLEALANATLPIAEASKGLGKNRDKFPAVNTDETDAENLWNGLNRGKYHMYGNKRCYHLKHQIGELALHHGFITANTPWNSTNVKFKDLSKKQKHVIASVLKTKDESYTIIGIRALSKSLMKQIF